jgi:putative heme-binding domain-containing protein
MKHNWTARALAISALFLTARFSMMAQGPRDSADVGAQQFEANCAVCHASDGSGGKAPALTTPNFVGMSDAALIKAVHDGTAAGMPPFAQLGDESVASVVHYLRTLQGQSDTPATGAVAGDAVTGRALYFGKAQCSSCHMIQGNGGFIASDLTAYGPHGADAIRKAIITPDTPLAPNTRVIGVQTKSGKKLAGMMRYEDNFNIALQTEDGRYHFLTKGDLADVQYTDHSLMPHDYGTRLTAEELADIIHFLIVTGQSTPAESAPSRRRGNDN